MNSPVPPSVHVYTGYDEGMSMGYVVDTSSQIWKKALPLCLSNYNKTNILVISKFQLTMEIWSVGIFIMQCLIIFFLSSFRPHYTLYLRSITVNGQLLPIDPAAFATSSNRGTIVDSGTTLAYLVEEAYDPFVSAVRPFLSCPSKIFFKGRIKSRETGVMYQ